MSIENKEVDCKDLEVLCKGYDHEVWSEEDVKQRFLDLGMQEHEIKEISMPRVYDDTDRYRHWFSLGYCTVTFSDREAAARAVTLNKASPISYTTKIGSQERSVNFYAEGVQKNKDLYAAVEKGSLPKINAAIANGADVNFVHYDSLLPGWEAAEGKFVIGVDRGVTALHLACWLGLDRVIVERLLEVETSNSHLVFNSGTPLHCASYSGKIELVALLLERFCSDPDEFNALFHNSQNNSPLLWAWKSPASQNHIEIIELYLSRGADVNEKDHCDGDKTYLMDACSEENIEMVELLLDRGANVNDTNYCFHNPLMVASAKGYKKILELLLDRGADIKCEDESYETSLIHASRNGHKEIVQLLLINDAALGHRNYEGDTALSEASQRGHLDIVAVLKNWPVTMVIVMLQELVVYHLLDTTSFSNIFEFIGEEEDDRNVDQNPLFPHPNAYGNEYGGGGGNYGQ